MNIVIINHYAGGPRFGMEFRPYYLAREWVKRGHQVLIVASTYAHLRSRQPVTTTPLTQECVDGVNYLWLKTNKYHGNGFARIVNMLIFTLRLYTIRKELKAFQPNLIIASSTYPMDNLPASWLSRKLKATLCYEVHDLWPLSPIEFGKYSKWHPFIMLVQWAEDFAYRRADFVVSLLPAAKSYMVSRGMNAEKFVYVPNGIALEEWNEDEVIPKEHESLLKTLNDKNQFIVGYTGSHGIANSLNSLISACHLLSNVAIVFVGDGPEKKNLIEQAKQEGLQNVYFLPPVARKHIPPLLKRFDALYVAFQKQSLLRFGMSPNKIFDYMMAQRPVIQAIEAGNNIAREYHCGIDVEPENTEAIAKGIEALQKMSVEERNMLGKNGKAAVLTFHNYHVLAQQFLTKYPHRKH